MYICFVSASGLIPTSAALALIYSKAIVDSFITVPKFPVIVISAFSGESNDSIKEYHRQHWSKLSL
jgi:hypothetical protein